MRHRAFLLVIAGGLLPLLGASKKDERVRLEQSVHVTRPLPKLENQQYGSFPAAAGVVADRVSYASGYAMRVPAIVYHPDEPKRKRHPALVVATGPNLDKSSAKVAQLALAYTGAGAVVLTYDPPGEFERSHLRLSHSGQTKAPLDPQMQSRLQGLLLEDLLQAVQYLAKRKDVDRRKIGLIDLGGGKTSANLTCAIETRLRACVLQNDQPARQMGDEGESDRILKISEGAAGASAAPFLQKRLGLSVAPRLEGEHTPSRYRLHALPESVWSESRERYVYETWLEHARAAIRSGAP